MQANQDEKMKILDFLSASAVVTELTATTKKGVLEELVGAFVESGKSKRRQGDRRRSLGTREIRIYWDRPGNRHSPCQDGSSRPIGRCLRVVPSRRAV